MKYEIGDFIKYMKTAIHPDNSKYNYFHHGIITSIVKHENADGSREYYVINDSSKGYNDEVEEKDVIGRYVTETL